MESIRNRDIEDGISDKLWKIFGYKTTNEQRLEHEAKRKWERDHQRQQRLLQKEIAQGQLLEEPLLKDAQAAGKDLFVELSLLEKKYREED